MELNTLKMNIVTIIDTADKHFLVPLQSKLQNRQRCS